MPVERERSSSTLEVLRHEELELARFERDWSTASRKARKAQLDAIIKQDQIYEARKKALENRVRIIEGLQKNQVSPVVALDVLSRAIDRTQYVWLSTLDQSNATFTMSGMSTSLNLSQLQFQ